MSENSFLSEQESAAINQAAKLVKDFPYLTLGVFPMLVTTVERKNDKNEQPYLRVNIDTGYEKEAGGPRMMNAMFYISGKYPDGRNKIDDFVRFMKSCFGISVITNEAIASIAGKQIAVATKKDADGFLQFWYAESIKELKTARRMYKPKQDDPRTGNPTLTPPSAEVKQARDSDAPNFLEGVEESEYEGQEPDSDDLPFN